MLTKRHPVLVLFIVVFVLQLIVACSYLAPPVQDKGWVVFPAEQASERGLGNWLVPNGQTAEYWTPSEENILALEDGPGDYLQTNSERFNEQKAPILKRLDEYNRQYFGIILAGKKVIYANYFCDSVESDWRKEFLFVMDGGDCFFQFKYDADSGEFFDLQVNGNA